MAEIDRYETIKIDFLRQLPFILDDAKNFYMLSQKKDGWLLYECPRFNIWTNGEFGRHVAIIDKYQHKLYDINMMIFSTNLSIVHHINYPFYTTRYDYVYPEETSMLMRDDISLMNDFINKLEKIFVLYRDRINTKSIGKY